ncbi:MAG: AraC family transcriptional regulator [Elusimicrobia bacterium]|nr:AraC family transcriptional regulator [Elusimicrobiota bacterium]
MKIERYQKEKKDIKLIEVTYLNPDPNWKIRKHYHTFHELVIVTKGLMHVEILGKNIHANAGDILFYQAGIAHKEQSDHKKPVETVGFTWKEKRKVNFPVLTHDINGKICVLSKWACEQGQISYPYKRLQQENIFEVIRIELIKIIESEVENQLVSKVKSFMLGNLNLDKSMTLDNLANYVHMSKYHFIKKYRVITGRTPMEDLRNIRLEVAKDLFLTTCMPIKAVATKVGFSNVFIFSRLFQKYFNLPPGHYRNNTDFNKNTIYL